MDFHMPISAFVVSPILLPVFLDFSLNRLLLFVLHSTLLNPRNDIELKNSIPNPAIQVFVEFSVRIVHRPRFDMS